MRLIDADDFIEYLGLDVKNAREDNIGEIVTLEDFDRQPTVFAKEKVIEELKQISKALLMAENFNGAACIDKAIEIVEKGGIE